MRAAAERDYDGTAIRSFSGTYVASGTYSDGTTQSPVTVTMVLQQGATSTSATGADSDLAYALSGTLAVQGVPCFRTGTTVAPATSLINGVGGPAFGSVALLGLNMDDGSLAFLDVYADDLNVSQFDSFVLEVTAGNCASTGQRQIRLGSFARQS